MRAVVIGKWQIVHNGHTDLFMQLASIGGLEKLLVGIGVGNKYGPNIFSWQEVLQMLEPVVKQTDMEYVIKAVPDVPDYEVNVRHIFEYTDCSDILVVSGNPYLLKNFSDYHIFMPNVVNDISATQLRQKIANGEDWQKYVPNTTIDFLAKDDRIDRIVSYERPIPLYVNLQVTNRCNMGCRFCFLGEHPDGVLPDLPTETIQHMIDKVAAGGARIINYTGGEPLLRPDITEIIRYGKEKGLKTILSTNGILLKNKMQGLCEYLDWICLPLDGYDSESHDMVRGRKGHFYEITRLLHDLRDCNCSIKINTMVCKKNLANIQDIGSLLDKHSVGKWKLFQFSARGKAEKLRQEYEISDHEFLSTKSLLGVHKFDVIYSSNELRDNSYFLVEADGKAYCPVGSNYLYIGNLISDPLHTFSKPHLLSVNKNIRNAELSYGVSK
ncbi:MAG: radical SAM protein [Candidatus Woesearchaeota archaeon]